MENVAGLFDARSSQARRELTNEMMLAFATMGAEARQLATSKDLLSKEQVPLTLAAGLTSAVACELVSGIVVLADSRVAYGAAALVRQLVETEYLAWAVTRDPEDALDWLTSTKKVRMAKWQPGRIRGRSDGRFPNKDYGDHCEVGGHPTPEGAQAILDNRDLWVEVSLYEASFHGANTWHYLLDAFESVEAIDTSHARLDEAIAKWHERDRLASWRSSET
jgi:hypothetical protein